MFGNSFYHGTIRKCITLFGNMFNDISIERLDKTGKSAQTIRVPIIYGPKDKYVAILQKNPNLGRTQVELPMMSFAITNISRSTNRQTNVINKNVMTDNGKTMKTSFSEIPYDLEIELSIYAKSYDDSAQIVEQILPYFAPDFNANLKFLPELNLNKDIKTSLNSVNPMIEYEGDVNTTRVITWTLSFTMEIFFIGPVSRQGIIRKVDVDIHNTIDRSSDDHSGTNIQITAGMTADGKPTNKKEESIPYMNIDPDDPYGFVSETSYFSSDKGRD